MIEPILFYGLILGVSLLAISFSLVAFSYKRILDKFYKLWEGREATEKAYVDASRIITDARSQALKIITDANNLATSDKSLISTSIQNISDSYREEYKEALAKISSQSNTALSNFSTEFEKEARAQFQTFLNSFAQSLNQKSTDFDRALEDYKKANISKIDGSIMKIIQEVSQSVLNKSISISDQEDLVMQELEEAKKRHEL